MQPSSTPLPSAVFTPYQKFVMAILVFLQFTIILDFMIISPLGAILMPALNITPSQFGWVVSAYAFSAGASGILAAGFADRFDRKKILLFFYTGFVLGTLFCGLASSYPLLLAARIITGLFGGVIGSVVFAIATDLFALEVRGRVMGLVQTAFAASQILGLPIGLFLANHWGWHMPFLMIVGISIAVGIVIVLRLQPINAHLKLTTEHGPFRHLIATVSTPRYIQAFATTALLSTGGFMLMPFSSAFNVHNVGTSLHDLPLVYLITGICAMIAGPFIGRLCDRIGKFKVFAAGSVITTVMALIYTRLAQSPLAILITVSVFMFIGISSRMISSQALMSAVPAPASRGSFMAVSASIQQISGGIASVLAGMIVIQASDGSLEHFDTLGNVVIGAIAITLVMMYFIQKTISFKDPKA